VFTFEGEGGKAFFKRLVLGALCSSTRMTEFSPLLSISISMMFGFSTSREPSIVFATMPDASFLCSSISMSVSRGKCGLFKVSV